VDLRFSVRTLWRTAPRSISAQVLLGVLAPAFVLPKILLCQAAPLL
jgi:hypothetical protein